MKKFFTLVAMATMALAASAQEQESAFIDVTALGLQDESGTAVTKSLTAGTEICKSASVSMKVAYDCDYKAVAMTGADNPCNAITIDGTTYSDLATGAQGQTNPTNTKKASTQQPTSGAIYQFDVTQDGWLYVFSKLSANKQYYAFEGAYSEATPSSQLAYTIVGASQGDKDAADAGKLYSGSIPADEEGYADYTSCTYPCLETLGTFYLTDLIGIRPSTDTNYGTSTFDNLSKNTVLGVAAFPVYAEGETYYFFAVGSKVTCDGFVFIPGGKSLAEIKVSKEDPSAVQKVAVAEAAADKVIKTSKGIIKNGVKYNFAGQRMN